MTNYTKMKFHNLQYNIELKKLMNERVFFIPFKELLSYNGTANSKGVK